MEIVVIILGERTLPKLFYCGKLRLVRISKKRKYYLDKHIN